MHLIFLLHRVFTNGKANVIKKKPILILSKTVPMEESIFFPVMIHNIIKTGINIRYKGHRICFFKRK